MASTLARFSIFANVHHMKNLEIFALVTVGVALSMIGDVLLKRSHEGSLWVLGGGLVFYFLGCIPVVLVFRLTTFGNVFILWEALTVILAVVVGQLLFDENITANKLVAIGLVVAAIIVLNR